jgi:hypothetical protein
MVKTLTAARGWLFTAISVLGVIFSFLFFGSSPETTIKIVWAYALVFFLLCLLVWLIGALVQAQRERRQTVAPIRGVFSNTGDPAVDLNFLLDPNDSFSSLLKCSIYYLADGVELYLGGAFVYNVQEDKRVQLKVSSREQSKSDIWRKVELSDKTIIEKLLVKVGERMP